MGRQAVVVIHGMGEQLPLDTLTRFVDVALAPGPTGRRRFYSRPESITGSLESRRFLAPGVDDGMKSRPQTEFFEYHWSDKMQGNRLDDLWPTFRRMVLCSPLRVPIGLRGIWLITWVLVLGLGWAVGWGPLSDAWREGSNTLPSLVAAAVSSAVASAVLSYILSRLLPNWLTVSFVDVVRYLDTSPRSYGVRREVRKGLVEMLRALQAEDQDGDQHYDRIVVVAHSLGAYIAYDALAHLWGLTYSQTSKRGARELAGLAELERVAGEVEATGSDAHKRDYQAAQGLLFEGLRATGNPWLITDFVSVGTPMYFADRLMPGKGKLGFAERKARRELPTCPPLEDEDRADAEDDAQPCYSWLKWDGRQALHEGAPFAVVRWTNLFFPARLGFFGDWFGGELAPLFGAGIRDVPVTGNKPWRLIPALAHSLYFRFPDDTGPKTITTRLRDAMALTQPSVSPPTVAGSGSTGTANEPEPASATSSEPIHVTQAGAQ